LEIFPEISGKFLKNLVYRYKMVISDEIIISLDLGLISVEPGYYFGPFQAWFDQPYLYNADLVPI